MQVWCQHGQKEHTQLIHTENKLFPASFVAKLSVLKKHAPLIHTEVYILWQLVHYELKPLEAYCAESYWSEAPICTFCDRWQV